MNSRALAVAAVVVVAGGVGLLYWATYVRLETWKCFHVTELDEPTPHTEAMDRYCVAKRGPDNNIRWFLLPGVGMENWRAIGGASRRIPLDATTDTDENKVFEFELHVTGHQNSSEHNQEHKKPRFGYELTVVVPEDEDTTDDKKPKAEATFRVAGGSIIHAGIAHSNED